MLPMAFSPLLRYHAVAILLSEPIKPRFLIGVALNVVYSDKKPCMAESHHTGLFAALYLFTERR